MISVPAPTILSICTTIVAGISGYMIGVSSSSKPMSSFSTTPLGKQTRVKEYENEIESEEEEIEDECLDHAPNWTNTLEDDKKDGLKALKGPQRCEIGPTWDVNGEEEHKMVLVVRTDLGMTKGKIAAQCSHAAVACYKRILFSNPLSRTLRKWERQGQTKVALQVKTVDELVTLQAMACSLGLIAEIISDAGRTQIESGSQTVLGIGPAPKSVIDKITGNLKLL